MKHNSGYIIPPHHEHSLIMTVGLPRSGKSTWVREVVQSVDGCPVVNPDSIRLALYGQRFLAEREGEVWAAAKLMVKSLFLYGHSYVVLDATNTSKKRRDEWTDDIWVCTYKVFDTPVEVCKARAIESGQEDLLPVIDLMAATFDPLDEDEARRQVVEVDW